MTNQNAYGGMYMVKNEIKRLAGVYPIISTPFTEDGGLDLHSLQSGVQGAVYPAIASEFSTLTKSERHNAVSLVAQTINQRIRFVVGISDHSPDLSAAHAQQAEELKADAIMLMSPRSAGDTPDDVIKFFKSAIGNVKLPVIMQNAPPPLGSSLSIETVASVCHAIPQIQYVKEEVVPCGPRISELLSGVPDLMGVFGGAGGRFVMDELKRGAAGSMPACEVPEIHAALYASYMEGDEEGARLHFNHVIPILNMGSVYRTPITKHILKARNIIDCSHHRDNNPVLDQHDRHEVDAIWALCRMTSQVFAGSL